MISNATIFAFRRIFGLYIRDCLDSCDNNRDDDEEEEEEENERQ